MVGKMAAGLSVYLEEVINWIIPDSLREDIGVYKRVRMFVISHLFGPFLGHPITIYLFLNDPNPFPHVHLLGLSVTMFWLFPIALRAWPKFYQTLALLSVMNLNFAILITAYHFGGANSPFLMWFLVVPLLAFFYLGSGIRTGAAIFSQIIIGLAGFYLVFKLDGSFPQHIPMSELVEITMISAFCASTYIFLMSAYYASVVDSQSELIKEVQRHEATTADLKAAKDEAERANGAKSEFLAKMSHELRTPLNAVLGYSEILLEDAELDGNGEQIADLQKISAAGKHLLSMVNDILDISKIEAGKADLYIETVEVEALLSEVEVTARPLAAKNTNTFEIEKEGNLGHIDVDLTKLRQAIFNLLSNAAKFCQNGSIKLIVKRDEADDRIVFAVQDTGIGIGVEALNSLFENFSQANAGVAAKFGGTGLGLSLSRNLCRLMGGDLIAESVSGQGSTFSIILPTRVEAGSGAAMDDALTPTDVDNVLTSAAADLRAIVDADQEKRSTIATDRDLLTVLMIDDDESYLELMERTLRKDGFDPIKCSEPHKALDLVSETQPDVILLDVVMPGMDGWSVVSELKASPHTQNIPVVVVSIMDSENTDLTNLVDAYVTKPVDTGQLKLKLSALLATRNAA